MRDIKTLLLTIPVLVARGSLHSVAILMVDSALKSQTCNAVLVRDKKPSTASARPSLRRGLWEMEHPDRCQKSSAAALRRRVRYLSALKADFKAPQQTRPLRYLDRRKAQA